MYKIIGADSYIFTYSVNFLDLMDVGRLDQL